MWNQRLQMTICRRVLCWISKAKHAEAHACASATTPSYTQKYVILFFTVTVVSRTRLIVTLYVRCLSVLPKNTG